MVLMMNKLEALAVEMRKLGWTASVRHDTPSIAFLKVEENVNLTSPQVRYGLAEVARFVWDGYTAKSEATMAKRLDSFLRECGYRPGVIGKAAP